MADQKIQELTDNLKEYVQIRYDLLRLELTKKISNLGANLTVRLLLAAFGILFLLFLSTAIGFLLSEYFESFYMGFLTVASFYAFLLVLLFLFGNKMIRDPLRDKIVSELLKEESDN